MDPTKRDVARTMSKIYDPMEWDEILDESPRIISRRLLKDPKDTEQGASVLRLWCCRSGGVSEFARGL